MDLSSSFSHFVDWLRRLGTNLYFWGGLSGLLLLAGVVYVTFNSYVMPSYTRHDTSISVPNVEEVPVEEARQQLTQKGLQVQEQEGRYNPNVARGLVVDQSPPPNAAVKPGRRVYLTVNSGEVPTVQLPDLTGTSLREARNRVTSIGLKVGQVREDSIPSPYPQTVTRQRPEPGDSLDQGSAIDLWYSTGLGSSTAQVPVLVGLRVDRARQLLLRQKLRSVVVSSSAGGNAEDADGSPTGSSGSRASADSMEAKLFVREQSRPPGTSVRTGTEIRLFTTQDSTLARNRRRAIPDSSFLRLPRRPRDTSAVRDTSSRVGF